MAVRAIIPFDRLPTVAQSLAAGVRLPGTLLYACDIAHSASTYWRTSDGWLTIQGYYVSGVGNAATKTLAVQNTLKSLVGTLSAASVVTVGARMKAINGNIGLHLQELAAASPTFLIFGTNGLSGDGVLGSSTAGKDMYMEVTLDIPNRVAYRWLDGVALASLTIPDWVITRFTNNTDMNLVFGFPGTYSQQAATITQMQLRDIYVLEKTSDGIMSSRLGPQVIKPLTVSSIVADGWTNNGTDTNLTAMRTAVSTVASSSTPLVTSDSAETPAVIKFNAGTVGTRINAVSLVEEALRANGADTRLQSSITEGTSTTSVVETVLTSTLDYYPVYTAARSPAGNKWTKDVIESLSIKLAPVTGA